MKGLATKISQALQDGNIDLANSYRAQLKNFRERFIPWAPDLFITENLSCEDDQVVIVLERVANDYVLYPSTNPGQIIFFHSRFEALRYANMHYANYEVTTPIPVVLAPEEAYSLADLFNNEISSMNEF